MFVAADLRGVTPITAICGLSGFKPSSQPVLASDTGRHVGEAVAVCVARSRAEAEDLAEQVEVVYEDLPVAADMLASRQAGAALLHAHWSDNVFLETTAAAGSSKARASAPIVVRRTCAPPVSKWRRSRAAAC